jgi:hypothetical protein
MSSDSDHETTAATRAKLAAQFGIGTVAGFRRAEVNGLEVIAVKFVDGTSILVREVSKGDYRTVKDSDIPPAPPNLPIEDRIYGADHVDQLPHD